MKRLAAILVLALLPLLPAVAGATTITLWTTEMPEERQAVITYLARVFGVLHEGMDVEMKSVEECELVERVVSSPAEERPTLVNAASELISTLGEKGMLQTDQAGRIIDNIGRDRFFSGALDMFSMPGGRGHYGVPFHGWVQGIWYRADWFTQAGLEPPTTWEAILKAARHFNQPENHTYGILVGTATDQLTEQVFTQFALSNDALMFDKDGRLVFNSPAMVETLAYYVELAKNTPPGQQIWRSRDYYLQGHLAMLFYSTFIMDDLALAGVAADSLTGDNFDELKGAPFDPNLARNTAFAPLIGKRRKVGYGMVNGFGLVKDCSPEDAETARKFIDFLYQPDHFVEWVHMAPGGMLPVLRDMAESEAFMRDPLGVFKRYGRPKVRKILSGLEGISSFALHDGVRHPLASVFYVERVVSRMIFKAVFEGVRPAQAVAWAEKEMRRIAASRKTGQPPS